MERTLQMTHPRAERLDALLSELSWSVEDLAQFVAERRAERGAGGLHNVNGNAKTDVKGTLQTVLLRQSRLPLGLCHEIASYFDKPSADLFVEVEEDEAHEDAELRAWTGNGASPAPAPPAAPAAKAKRTRTKRAGGDPALIAARAAALQAAIDASGKSAQSIARELQPVAKKVPYMALLVANWRTGKQLLPDDVIPAIARFLNADEAALRAGIATEAPPPVETASAPAAPIVQKEEPAPPPVVSSALIAPSRSPENALVEAAVAGSPLAHAAPPEGMMFIPVSREGVLELLRKSTTVQVGRSGDNLVVGAQVVITPKNLLDLFG